MTSVLTRRGHFDTDAQERPWDDRGQKLEECGQQPRNAQDINGHTQKLEKAGRTLQEGFGGGGPVTPWFLTLASGLREKSCLRL